MSTLTTFHKLYSVSARQSKSMMQALAFPVKRTLSEKFIPALRYIPGYLIMTPYTGMLLMLIGISFAFGLED